MKAYVRKGREFMWWKLGVGWRSLLMQPKFVIGQDLRDVLRFSIQPGLGHLKYGNMMYLTKPKGNMLQYEEHFMMELEWCRRIMNEISILKCKYIIETNILRGPQNSK